MRDWMGSSQQTHYTIGSVVGPHPFPMIVRDFQAVIGRETKRQCLDEARPAARLRRRLRRRRLERRGDVLPVRRRRRSSSIGVEAGGRGPIGRRARLQPHARASPACCTAASATCSRTTTARPQDVHSISAGLDYPGVGPEHSYWKDAGRVRYESITDAEALDAYHTTARLEGILPALESSHAVAQALKEAPRLGAGKVLVVCLSGRGDKDAYEVARLRGEPM